MHRTLSAILLVAPLSLAAQVGSITRSDSLDLLHTRIELDLRNVLNGTIAGVATITAVPQVPIATAVFDLLQLQTDSVFLDGQLLSFSHAGELLTIDLGQTHAPGDTLQLVIHYSGDPAVDASGWGGFYTLGSYQYDLGVAFDAVPHSYGRSWFPCFDNFVERCSFEFIVTTAGGRTVFANGHLLSEEDLGGGELRTHWRLDEHIPSYLASVASTNYVAAWDTVMSITGDTIPVTLVAKPADTTDLKNSFIHLPNAFHTFERWFGAYRWDRVGYCLTTQGAMEHPTNICYPASIADGTLAYEATMAHELAHHWFGDLITCRRAEEMYINEGFAEYLSYLFLEDLYGPDAYMDVVRDVHHDMLVKAHLMDEGWHALSEVPQAFTYGEHSYRKGADVIHSLRGYLGDSLFSAGFIRVLANNAFSDMSTEELRDSLMAATGYDLSSYFADHILQPGWAAFEVDSMTAVQNGAIWNTTVYIQQKLRHADHLYDQVPATLTFEAMDGTRWDHPAPVLLGGASASVQSEPPFAPRFAFINLDERLSLATSTDTDTLTEDGTTTMQHADVSLVVNMMPSPSPIRVEEIWTAADDNTAEPFAYHVSPDRWWRITGQLAPGALVDMRITVDGRATSSTLVDPGLVQDFGAVPFIEDSLVVLYRPDARTAWTEWLNVDLNTLGLDNTNGYARLTVNDIALGDYVVAWRKSATSIAHIRSSDATYTFLPNPASDNVLITVPADRSMTGATLLLHALDGRVLSQQPLSGTRCSVSLLGIAPGTTHLSVRLGNGRTYALGELIIVPHP